MERKSLKTFLTAEWRNLIFLSFRVNPLLVTPYLPAGTCADLYEGSAVLSLVAFEFLQTKFAGVRPPLFHSFSELNLRFYARDLESDTTGVVFIKEICPYTPVALAARFFYNEKFLVLPCRSTCDNKFASYHFGEKDHGMKVGLSSDKSSLPSSIEGEFITERYHGYSKWGETSSLHYEVSHLPWEVRNAHLQEYNLPLERWYGPALSEALQSPCSVLYSPGSEISLSQGQVQNIKNEALIWKAQKIES